MGKYNGAGGDVLKGARRVMKSYALAGGVTVLGFVAGYGILF